MNYIRDFLEINSVESNEELIETLLFLSVSVLSEIVLDRMHFKKNKDLKQFTTDVLLESYKDYLFDSRPTLYARIVKDLRAYKKNNKEHFLQLEKNIQHFLSTKYNEEFEEEVDEENTKSTHAEKNKKQQSSNKKVIDDWRSIIES
ncbi:hypothetical protein P9257_18035 [Bacillus velezensis]|uniref:hypothetical protein n=2 Tax=Bacillus amyloliquefaciens group TaxID=1938374 RepID=UPI002E238256|nr:hypothetical protein [Bacillus velezensis]